MNYMDRVIFGCILLIGLGFSVEAQACSTTLWDGGTSGAIAAGSPTDNPTAIPRVSELCGLSVTGTGHVQDNKPNGATDTRIIARFYVLVTNPSDGLTGSGTVDLFESYSSETPALANALFKVSYDSATTSFIFDSTATGGGSTFSIAAADGWNLVELDWDSVGGNFSATVDHPDLGVGPIAGGPVDSGSGIIDSVRLGAPNGFDTFTGGRILFDSYEAHRTTAVGPLLIGDANADAAVNIFDYGAVQSDISGVLQSGQPDCNLDGAVNIFDYGCVQTRAGG